MLFLYLLVLICFTFLVAIQASGDDKNGVAPNTISLPSGPGSVEGLGESFQPMLNTGTAKYGVKFALPAGVAGHTPQLALSYESGFGDGPAGIGWKFGPGGVCRQTDKGIPRYVEGPNGVDDDHDGDIDEPDEVDRLIGLEDEELVQLTDGSFRARIEGTFIRYRRVNDHWEAHLKDGTKLEFGMTAQARVTDKTGFKVFKRLLEKSTDTNGNVIKFYYTGFSGSDNQKYLKEIRYGPGTPDPESGWPVFYFAHLIYEDRPDWRTDYRSGFLIKTTKRLSRVDIGIQGVTPAKCALGDWNEDGTGDALIRRYVIAYDPDFSHISFLTSITQFGSDGENYLPPISFTYSSYSPDQTTSSTGAIIESSTAPSSVMDSELVELIDMNRDGLPDILKTDLYGGSHTCYYNLGVKIQGSTPDLEWDEGRSVTSPYGLAAQLHLKEKEVHFADMDGNGISDLIQTTYADEVYYFLNQGNGSWGERKWMSIQDTAPPPPFTDDDIKTADLDFDKRMDVVKSTENGYTVWFNLEEGKYSEEVRTAGASYEGQVIRFSYTGVHLADMNGDRISDVVRVRPTQVIYCPNMGHGMFDPGVEMAIPDTVLTDGANGQVEKAKLEDINGDGLADLVVDRAEGTELWYWLNRGTDTFSEKHVITDMPTTFGVNMVTRWADMNGNGTTDLVYADSTAESRLRILDIGELTGGSAHPNLLTGIDNGLGVQTEISYRSSTAFYQTAQEAGKPWSSTIPFPVQVVSQVRTTTGLDVDLVPGVDEYRKTYTYRDGFYEDREKAFRGFAEVTVAEYGDATAPTRMTTHTFFTGGPDGVDNDGDGEIDEVAEPWWHREEDALKGLVRGVDVRAEDGFHFSEQTNDWAVKTLLISTDLIEVRLAYNRATEKLIYEGLEIPEILRTEFEYDDFNNVTAERNYGALSITGDEAFTFAEYINDTNAWRIGFPQRQYVTDGGGQTFSETLSYYDGPDYSGLPLGQVGKGNLTRQEGWIESSTYVDLVRNAYDSYGNITGILDPNGNQRTIAYDSTLHRFPEQEVIEVGGGMPDLTVTAAYNLGLGVVTSSIDFNDHQTDYGYDTFGRLTSIVRPGDSISFPTLAFSYTAADPDRGLVYDYDAEGVLTLTEGITRPSSIATFTREVSDQAGTFDTIQYTDGMGRKLATLEEGEEGFIVNEAVLFNAMGSVRYAFLPYTAATSTYVSPVPGSPLIETHYDATGREILTINPPDSVGIVTYSSNIYLPLEIKVTDENVISKSLFSDGLERLVSVQEDYEEEILVTRYDYDPLGNLTQITDAQDNVKTMEYDGLNRRTLLNDPDRGRMEYVYDDAGNLIQTTDNKGQVIIYTYDGANRILAEDYLDASGITPDVAFHYDEPSADYPDVLNLKGHLSWIQDLSGGQFFSYDDRGNTKLSVKRIADQGSFTDYGTSFVYDAMDRVVSIAYPDGEGVTYAYNNRSLLESIPGFVNSIDYYPSGQIAKYTYANGLTTTYAYDPRNRLNRLTTDTTIPSGNPIQDLAYTFDGVSNIMSITDYRTLPPDSPKNTTQAFQYDDVYRLTRAEGPGYGAIDYQYDKIGNMIFKGSPAAPDPQHIDDPLINLGIMASGGVAGTSGRSVKLPGDAPGPHAITSTESGMVFDYDDNGNMIDHDSDVYEWDFKDRLIRVQKGATDSSYMYDYSGQRVTKKVNEDGTEKTTFYITETFEIREDKTVKYVFSDTRRVARIETKAPRQTLVFQPGWNFFSLEVEPDNSAIDAILSSIAGSYTDVWAFDPETQQYVGYVPSESITDLSELHAQEGYLIKITVPAILTVTGTRVTGDINVSFGWNLVPCPTDTLTPVTEALSGISGLYEMVWGYDTATNTWQNYAPNRHDFINTLDTVQPGRAYWLKMNKPGQLSYQQQPRTIHFYHPDHLGSSNVVTDASGTVVESTEFYPYGRPRHEERNGFDSAYKYTGKELDKESDLMYYGARYYDTAMGKFISVDPLVQMPEGQIGQPLLAQAYLYTNGNPIVFIDPDGQGPKRKGKRTKRKNKRNRRTGSVGGAFTRKDLAELVTIRLLEALAKYPQYKEGREDEIDKALRLFAYGSSYLESLGKKNIPQGKWGWPEAGDLGEKIGIPPWVTKLEAEDESASDSWADKGNLSIPDAALDKEHREKVRREHKYFYTKPLSKSSIKRLSEIYRTVREYAGDDPSLNRFFQSTSKWNKYGLSFWDYMETHEEKRARYPYLMPEDVEQE